MLGTLVRQVWFVFGEVQAAVRTAAQARRLRRKTRRPLYWAFQQCILAVYLAFGGGLLSLAAETRGLAA